MSAPEEDDFLLDGSDAEQDDFVLEDAPAPAPSAAENKTSQKSKLAELANRKRREQVAFTLPRRLSPSGSCQGAIR
jgi:hypothetical protein